METKRNKYRNRFIISLLQEDVFPKTLKFGNKWEQNAGMGNKLPAPNPDSYRDGGNNSEQIYVGKYTVSPPLAEERGVENYPLTTPAFFVIL